MSLSTALETLQAEVGQETHISDWLTVDQSMIDKFADATLDFQWIHTNKEKAMAESPFGNTVAHGFLSLSLISYLTGSVDTENPRFPDIKLGVNYGMNKVRFPAPVLEGSKIRSRTTLLKVEEVAGNGLQATSQVTIEIEGQEKPACVAEILGRLYF